MALVRWSVISLLTTREHLDWSVKPVPVTAVGKTVQTMTQRTALLAGKLAQDLGLACSDELAALVGRVFASSGHDPETDA